MSDTTPEHENHEGTEPTAAEPTLIEPMSGDTTEIPEDALPAFFAEPAAPADAAPEAPAAPEYIPAPPAVSAAAAAAAEPAAPPAAATPQPYFPEAPITLAPPATEVDYAEAQPTAVDTVPEADISAGAATVATATAVEAPAATGVYYDPNAGAPIGQYAAAGQPIFVQAPIPPSPKGNRGAGILIGLLATLAFAILYAGSTFLISLSQNPSVEKAGESFALFVSAPVFYIPVLFFFGAFALLAAIVNRGGWWAYVLGGFAVAVIVYFSFIGGSLLTVRAWELTPGQAGQFIAGQWLNPVAIVAAIAAREVPIWFGAWIAARGRKVTARNLAVRQEYDRVLAEGPTLTRQ
ncbi:hypothetical protein [Microterricola pindariensis]|uniref:ABC transporter n=1 Tax=Microterricola pindariensis TaxID=478010 RepID=A0ABX5B0A8_9MICO|nr:hypothetical protein [Microterricola pindariensis]PPL20049.1 hypothetical protein GY24_02795 [Microterricola pindariensis]